MQISFITDHQSWNQLLLSLPDPHILQSFEWGAFKSRHGWTPIRLAFHTGDRVSAAASVLRRRIAPLPFAIMYAPKGPLLDFSAEATLTETLAALESLARREHALFIKIDPNVPVENEAVQQSLQRRGWQPSAEQIQFRNTLLTDLRPSEDDLLAGMKPKWRYNIRLATRKGVRVRDGSHADLPAFYAMYAETGARDGFITRPLDYYQDAWGSFMDAGLAHLLLAELDGELLAGVMLFHFGPTAWYMYGASRHIYRDTMPNHLLQWEAMRWAKAHGCTTYDWWGAPDVLDESDRMWGVYRFKEGFGGKFVQTIGAWDYPVLPVLYRLYTVAIPRYLDLLRRHQAQAAGR